MTDFSLDEAYGVAKPAAGGGDFSLDEAYGTPLRNPETTQKLSRSADPLSAESMAAENKRDFWRQYITGDVNKAAPWESAEAAKASAKRIATGNVTNLASGADLFASMPAQVASVVTDLHERFRQLVGSTEYKNLSPADARKAIEAEQERVLSQYAFTGAAALAQKALPANTTPSGVEQAMGAVTEFTKKAGVNLEAATNGAVKKENFNSLVNEVFGVLGLKGMAGLGKSANAAIDKTSKAKLNEQVTPNADDLVLKSALEKVNDGRGFELTTQEKLAFRDRIVQAQTEGSGPKGQRGAIDWNAIQDETPLRSILERLPNTLKTLERLGKGRFEFSKEQILQVLNQADISKAEKDILGPIVAEIPQGGRVSAKVLVQQAREGMASFDLEAKPSQEFAHYGLENIDRLELPDNEPVANWESVSSNEMKAPEARTTLYRSPSISVDPDSNHFGDTNLFGWTRSFEEGGIPHVVELQSDLAQKAKTGPSPERVETLKSEIEDWTREKNAIAGRTTLTSNWEKAIRGMLEQIPEVSKARLQARLGMSFEDVLQPGAAKTVDGPWPGQRLDARSALDQLLHARTIDLDVLIRENKIRLAESQTVKAIAPMLPSKHWTKRLVREEIAQAERAGKSAIRFATPDTVAKVEGWPREGDQVGYGFEETGRPEGTFSPEHQSIYDRYGDIEKFLTKDLKGTPYTDPHGHTWIEVPLTREARRPAQFGGADPELLKRIGVAGAGAAVGMYLADGDQKARGGIMGAAVGLLGGRARGPIAKGADYGLGMLSTRIRNLSEPLLRRGRDYERLTREATHRDINAVDPFLRRLNQLDSKTSLSSPRKAAIAQALTTNDPHLIRQAIAASGDAELQAAWPAVEKVVSRVDQDLLSRNLLDISKLQYFPAMKDAKGVFAAPAEALHTYLSTSHRTLEKARFFGRDLKLRGTEIDSGESIRALAKREQASGRITADGAEELRSMLYSRFGKGEMATNPTIQGLKNWAYAGLLANPVSALAQIGDVATTAGVMGLRPTLASLAQKLAGRKRIGIKDFGLVDLNTEEFFNTPHSAKFLNGAMKAGGFSLMDTFGKDVTLGAALSKFERLAQNAPGKIFDKYEKMYGYRDTQQLVADLKRGKQTDLVRSLLFNELSDVQPISKLEVPQGYLDMPNGRVIYMLKTWALKQADVVRREAYNEIKAGHMGKGLGNLAKWALIFGAAGMTTSAIQDWLLGRKVKLNGDAFAENLFRTFGWTNFVADKLRQGQAKDAIGNLILPPADMFAQTAALDPKAVQYIPIAGKLIYNHGMGGAEKADKAAARAEKRRNRKGKGAPL